MPLPQNGGYVIFCVLLPYRKPHHYRTNKANLLPQFLCKSLILDRCQRRVIALWNAFAYPRRIPSTLT